MNSFHWCVERFSSLARAAGESICNARTCSLFPQDRLERFSGVHLNWLTGGARWKRRNCDKMKMPNEKSIRRGEADGSRSSRSPFAWPSSALPGRDYRRFTGGCNGAEREPEETIINQDGRYLLETIRSGSWGIDDLTNYVEAIIITNTVFRNNAVVSRRVRAFTNSVNAPLASRLHSGLSIISNLTTPKLRFLPNGNVESNTVTAFVRSITGVASEKSMKNPSVAEFAFRYMVRSEVIPFTQPPVGTNEVLRSRDLANNLVICA
jgi:hypothetical protein